MINRALVPAAIRFYKVAIIDFNVKFGRNAASATNLLLQHQFSQIDAACVCDPDSGCGTYWTPVPVSSVQPPRLPKSYFDSNIYIKTRLSGSAFRVGNAFNRLPEGEKYICSCLTSRQGRPER
jgi:hypothetical protein